MKVEQRFINILLLIMVAANIAVVFYMNFKLNQTRFGATVLTTNLSDMIGTFRTNVNTSFTNLNNALSSSTLWVNLGTSIYPTSTDYIVGIGTTTPAFNLHIWATTSSTLGIGNTTSTGCMVIGDTDRAGITYLTALNGVLSATTTKPSICK